MTGNLACEVLRRNFRRFQLTSPECDGHALFEHADALVEILEPHPRVSIVLSTSWVSVLGFDRAKGYLPQALQKRVRGATYHSTFKSWWDSATRHQQIAGYVMRHRLTDWIAVDDNDVGWPEEKRHHLVHTDEQSGLGDQKAQEILAHKLANGVAK
ncbi:HAD domain-containing protein [Ferrovum myxofaciens]|uniref:HAD domain-containing protein n=1 Tax=Ferrovum myxofaciens TaxID=416213 RepID=UPI0023520A98|nr:HAD domain-containing protein [Ferrovum myxofaciens]